MTDPAEIRTKIKQLIVLANERGIYYNYDERKWLREGLEIWQRVDSNCEKIKEHQKDPNY